MNTKLSRAFGLTLLTREAQLAFGLLNSVLLARWLGPGAVGSYFLVVGGANLIALVATLGQSYANIHLAAKDPGSAGRLFTQSVLPLLALALPVSTVLWLIPGASTILLGDLPAPLHVQAWLGSAVIALGSNVASILYGLHRIERYGVVTVLPSVLVGLVSVGLILGGALSLESAVLVWLLSNLAGTLVSAASLWSICPPVWSLDLELCRESLAVGFRSLVSALLSFATGRGTIIFVNKLLGKEGLGYFSLALRVAEILQHIPGALATVIFTQTSSRDLGPTAVARQLRLHLIVTGAGALAMIIGAQIITSVAFGSRFAAAAPSVRILALGNLFLGVWNVAGSYVAGRRGMPAGYVAMGAFSAAATLALYAYWIPAFGLAGAAWAWTVPNIVTSLMVLAYFLRIADGEVTVRQLVPGRADVAWLLRAPRNWLRGNERLRAVWRHARTRWRIWDEYKPWKRAAVSDARSAAAAARARPREARHAVFVAERVAVRQAKLACALRAAGWRVTLLVGSPPSPALAAYFPEVSRFHGPWDALEQAARFQPVAFHLFADWHYETPATFIRHAPGPVVLDINDVAAGHTIPQRLAVLYPGQEALERYCVENADAMCCRSLETQLLKSALGYRFRGPRLFFPDYTVSDAPDGPRRAADGEIHVVHTGVFIPEIVNPAGRVGHFLEVARILAADRVHFHLYECTGHPGTVEEVFGEYLALERETPFFHFHRFVPPDQLLADMKGYDFGLFVAGIELTFRDRDLDYTNARADLSLPNRIFEYIRCGLPLVLHDGRFIAWYAARVGVAHVVTPEFLRAPRRWLEARIPGPAEQVKLAAGRDAVDVRRHGPRLARFYESVAARVQQRVAGYTQSR